MSAPRIGRLKARGFAAAALIAVGAAAWSAPGDAETGTQDGQTPAGRTFAQPLLRPSTFPSATPSATVPLTAPVKSTAEKAAPQPAGDVKSAPAPAPARAAEPSWPKTVPDAKAEAEKPEAFSPDEIAQAKAQCSALLKGLDVVVLDEPAFKYGACGTPAPVQLVSIGKNPQVALSPPVTVTCDVVAAMHSWVTRDLQPLAKKHLGAPIVGIGTMSSYSCRNAYGRKRTNLSEHARANAIDIRGFTTSDARETVVLNDWGPTAWEIRAQVAAAAKAAAEKAAADKIAAEKAAKAQSQQAAKQPSPALPTEPPSSSAGSMVPSVPSLAGRLPGADIQAEGRKAFGIKPSQLGGPKAGDLPAKATPEPSSTRRAQFLREAHDTACKIFGTTLGPETNLAHKNHFHVDMAERTRGNFCE